MEQFTTWNGQQSLTEKEEVRPRFTVGKQEKRALAEVEDRKVYLN
jgi:hypothetical protein